MVNMKNVKQKDTGIMKDSEAVRGMKKRSKKKVIIIASVVVVLVLLVTVVPYTFALSKYNKYF